MANNKKNKFTSTQLSLLAGSMSLLLFFTQTHFFANNSNIKKPEDIDTNVSALGLEKYKNILYNDFKNEIAYIPLQYNRNQPIYYAISPKFDEDVSGYISDVMNEYTELFKDINPDITFQELPYAELMASKIMGNKVIEYVPASLGGDAIGCSETTTKYNLASSPNTVGTSNTIKIDVDTINGLCTDKELEDWSTTKANQFKYTIRHEMLHALGMADVYSKHNGEQYTQTLDYTTFINPDNRYTMLELSPVDYATLQALYTPLDLTIPENKEIIDNKIAEYSDKFYNNLSQRVCQLTQDEPVKFKYDTNAVDGKCIRYMNGNRKYRIDVNGDKFSGECVTPEYTQPLNGAVHYTDYGVVLDDIYMLNSVPYNTGSETYTGSRFYTVLTNGNTYVSVVQLSQLVCCSANITEQGTPEASSEADSKPASPKLATNLPDIVAGKTPDFVGNIDINDYIK